MELAFHECQKCKMSFMIESKTGEYDCPKCGSTSEVYVTQDLDDEDIEIIKEVFDSARKVTPEEIKNNQLLDLIVKIHKDIKSRL